MSTQNALRKKEMVLYFSMLNTSRKQTLETAVQTNENKYSQPRIDRPKANPVSIKISNKRCFFNNDAGTNFQPAQGRKMKSRSSHFIY